MPCASSNVDYPDYLKNILKQIEAGNDTTLKNCACSLKSPVTDEGCPVVDEDGKVGAFPLCWEFTEDTSLVGDGTLNPIKLTLKDAMWLYWQSKDFTQTFKYIEVGGCGPCSTPIAIHDYKKKKYERYVEQDKELVCKKERSLIYDLKFTGKYSGGGDPPVCVTSENSYDYSLAGFFFNMYQDFCGVNPPEVPVYQYYIKEGNDYYFYPSFLMRYATYNTGWSSYEEACVNVALIGQDNMSIKIDKTTVSIPMYQRFDSTAGCVTAIPGNRSDLVIT